MSLRTTYFLIVVGLCVQVTCAQATSTAPLIPVIDVPNFAAQVVASRDNQGLPFLVVDKVQATVWTYTVLGFLIGSSPALVGSAIGDTSVKDIGKRKLSAIKPEERTTPSGRFPSVIGTNLERQKVLWVDYDAAVSMHRIIKGKPSERRTQRMATPTPADNRVTYGCINVPAAFFNVTVLPTVRENGAIVYVLPETRPMTEVFDFLQAPKTQTGFNVKSDNQAHHNEPTKWNREPVAQSTSNFKVDLPN